MPNHVANRVQIDSRFEEIAEFMTDGDRIFDFNKIIPMPASMDISCDGYSYPPITQSFRSSGDSIVVRVRELFSDNNDAPRAEEALTSYLGSVENYIRTGYSTWYDWCNANWGTKWNSYDCDLSWTNGVINFNTAWAGVPDLIRTLSLKFPDVIFSYGYSSEDTGYEVGEMKFKNGEVIEENIPEGGSHEAYELYVRLHPDINYIKLVDGKYWYMDDDYPEENHSLED